MFQPMTLSVWSENKYEKWEKGTKRVIEIGLKLKTKLLKNLNTNKLQKINTKTTVLGKTI